jgi:hypothetical protein
MNLYTFLYVREHYSDCADNIRYYGKNLVSWMTRYLGSLHPSGKDTPYIIYKSHGRWEKPCYQIKKKQ